MLSRCLFLFYFYGADLDYFAVCFDVIVCFDTLC